MKLLKTKIDSILKSKGLNRHKITKLIGVSDGTLSKMVLGTKPLSNNVKEKLLPILEVSREELDSWVVVNTYPKEIIERAVKAYTDKEKGLPLLTQNIDKLLAEKGLNRTDFSKIIDRSQSGFNRVVTTEETLSDENMERISAALDIPKEDLQAWVLADKYSLKTLELALRY